MTEFTPAEQEIAAQYPAIARHAPETIRQLATFDSDADNGPTHPEVWLTGNALDYFLSTGAVRRTT